MIREEQKMQDITPESLIRSVQAMKDGGKRLVQIGCARIGDIFEINYSFDKDYNFENLKLTIPSGLEVPSVSGIYTCAFVYENEIHDLYGIEITGIAIDFKGTFIRTSIKYPFGVVSSKEEDACQNKL